MQAASFIHWLRVGHGERCSASDQVLSNHMLTVVRVNVSGGKRQQLVGSSWCLWAHCSAVVRQDAALCSFCFSVIVSGVFRGNIKTDKEQYRSLWWCCCNPMPKIFPCTFMRAALASVSAMQSCHISHALQSLSFISVGEKKPKPQTKNPTKMQNPFWFKS